MHRSQPYISFIVFVVVWNPFKYNFLHITHRSHLHEVVQQKSHYPGTAPFQVMHCTSLTLCTWDRNLNFVFFIGLGIICRVCVVCRYVWGSYVYSAYLLLACGYAKPDLWYELARNLKSRPRDQLKVQTRDQLKVRPRDQQTKDQQWARLRTDRNSWLTLSSRKAWSWKDKDRQNFYPTWNCETKHLGDVMPTCTQWSKGLD